jgi:UDP-N-acetylmuramate dehydrogenase
VSFLKDYRGFYKADQPLAGYTTFKIGGRAKFYFEPKDINALKKALLYCHNLRLPRFILGGGSNLLVSDRGFSGLVLRLCRKDFSSIEREGNRLVVGCGARLPAVLSFAQQEALAGLEFLAGVPGTVGGALVMSAGTRLLENKEVFLCLGDLVDAVWVLDKDLSLRKLSAGQIRFSYRDSNLKQEIVLAAQLRLKKGKKAMIMRKMQDYWLYKRETQDLRFPSAGCVFKNPPGISAGWLIEQCGLKGAHRGDAYVSERHANFIVNKGRAKAIQVRGLMRLIQQKVEQKYAILLEPEIKFIGD